MFFVDNIGDNLTLQQGRKPRGSSLEGDCWVTEVRKRASLVEEGWSHYILISQWVVTASPGCGEED